jgi:Tfp pilus assembly protein PilX
MDTKTNSILKNQSGAALVIALIMMVVLTLIGLASIFTSTFEMKISGNKKGSTDAFYAADSGAQVVTANALNFSSTHSNPYNPFADNTNPNPTNPTNAQAAITYNGSQQGAPRGYGISATQFQFEYFLIASTGTDQTDSSLVPSTCTVQEKVVRLIPTLQGGY